MKENGSGKLRTVFLRIIGISIIPLFIMGTAICIFTDINVRKILEEEIKKELRTAAYGLGENYGLMDQGDYRIGDDGTVFKGETVVSGHLGRLGDEYLKNGLVCTFFFEDTRIDTTVTDQSGNSMAGSKLDSEIYGKLCTTGEELFCEAADLGGRTYYGYYIPKRNSDGEVRAVFFAGRLRSEVMKNVKVVTETIIFIGFAMLLFGIVVSLLCAIYMVSYILRHFQNEENTRTKQTVSQERLDFMALVSREVRDPVDAITILSDRILEEETSPHIREEVLGIKGASNSLMISLDSVYEYSRLESGEIAVNADEYDITKLVGGCCDKARPGIERKGLDFKVEYNRSMPVYLKGDYEKLRQILDNLLENAVKYTFDGGVVLDVDYRKITAEKIDVTFTVTDTGVGIRKEDAQKLFSSIGKVGQNKNVSIKGTGLGLLICKRLVSVLDGRISVESEIGKGSKFRFSVPQDVLNEKTVGEYMDNGI
ncbi:MAG: cache domain-containing protein [Lachnospiraceae bacterium]|nr:cache domain-containing protein [Lachnospiraceae bacterium]